MKVFISSLFFVSILYLFSLFLPGNAKAVTYACVGSYTCTKQNVICDGGCSETQCGPATTNCPGGVPPAGTCCYSGTSSYAIPCSGLPVGGSCNSSVSCPNPYYIDGSFPVCTVQTIPGGCQVNSDCGANSQCCANPGNDNYCSTTCTACNGSNICPTSTPTPTAGVTCPGGASPGSYCNDFCNSCGTSETFVYDNSCNCVDSGSSYSQPACNNCGTSYCTVSCGVSGTPAPTASSTPAPSGVTCGAGTFLCGFPGSQTCCNNGDGCTGAGTCIPAGGFPTVTPAAKSLSGTVFYDTNGNGTKDAGETGAFGIAVNGNGCDVSGNCDGGTVNTDFSGNYTINLTSPFYASLTYNVAPIIFGGGYISIPSSRTAAAGATGLDFGLWQGNTITATVFKDTNANGIQDAGESGYQGASVNITTGDCADGVDNDGDGKIDIADTRCHSDFNANNSASYNVYRKENGGSYTNNGNTNTNSSGNVVASGLNNGTWQVYLNTVPANYNLTTAQFVKVPVNGGNSYTAKIGINLPAPVCNPASISQNPPGQVLPGQSVTLNINSCTNVEPTPTVTPPPPFTWNPDTPPTITPTPTISGQTDSCAAGACSSTTTWTAPTCPTVTHTYNPSVVVAGNGSTTTYQTPSGITVPGTNKINVNVRSVNNSGSCLPTDGTAYKDTTTGLGATVNVINTSGTYSINQNQVTKTTEPGPGTSFSCEPPTINYQVALQPVTGYSIVGVNNNGTQVFPGSSPVTVTNLNSDRTITFCIAPIDPWFQTSTGDVRFLTLSNPVPAGQFGSTGENTQTPANSKFPGIFYSSQHSNSTINGSISSKGWFINGEYNYNADTENRNGGMSYDFYKAKAQTDGVTIKSIPEGRIDLTDTTAFPTSGVYEVDGTGTITGFSGAATITGKRIVLLAKGNVNIDQPIQVTSGNGLFILAAKGDITVDPSLGAPAINSTVTSLEGIYTAQGSIVFNSVDNTCKNGNPDKRINIGGALVANSLKPFSSSGLGHIQNLRSLCLNNLSEPSLYVAQRPDFLTQMTNFYKTSYTKWKEVNP